ncbi:hypothetical protein FB451DRAFT_1257800 [Mycena latifolia]|nr:hypothetical protein FB451DRAFT_1257800 [Mycena latifolia]
MPADRTHRQTRSLPTPSSPGDQLKGQGCKPRAEQGAVRSDDSILSAPRRTDADSVQTQKIPRSPNKFMCYRSSVVKQLETQYPGVSQTRLSELIANSWNTMTEEQREPFKKLADKLKAERQLILAMNKSIPPSSTPCAVDVPTETTTGSHYRDREAKRTDNLKPETGSLTPRTPYYRNRSQTPNTEEPRQNLCSPPSALASCPGTTANIMFSLNAGQWKIEPSSGRIHGFEADWRHTCNVKVENENLQLPSITSSPDQPPNTENAVDIPFTSVPFNPASGSAMSEPRLCPGTTPNTLFGLVAGLEPEANNDHIQVKFEHSPTMLTASDLWKQINEENTKLFEETSWDTYFNLPQE